MLSIKCNIRYQNKVYLRKKPLIQVRMLYFLDSFTTLFYVKKSSEENTLQYRLHVRTWTCRDVST
jgi:hypothetical protein